MKQTGTLAPHSQAYIKLNEHEALLDGLQSYSHLWILFHFHANTDSPLHTKKTKIRPPRADTKVGMLASRSPHRPNPIGLSLVGLVRVEKNVLIISGVDLVNGTPVYDIKPCVPWDIPTTTLTSPSWVTKEDTLPSLHFSPTCIQTLEEYHSKSYFAPFYPPPPHNDDDETDSSFQNLLKTIEEVLRQDPRATHVRGSNNNSSNNNDNVVVPDYNILFCHVKIVFAVKDGVVHVLKAEYLDDVVDGGYEIMDGIPILSSQS